MKISTGEPESHPTPLPVDASHSPAVAPPTVREPSGTEQGAVMPTTAMFAEQAAAGTADVSAAMAAGMAADAGRRGGYERDIQPLGAQYGDLMTLPGGYPDSGTVGGLTSPAGYFYDPPRAGAPETSTTGA